MSTPGRGGHWQFSLLVHAGSPITAGSMDLLDTAFGSKIPQQPCIVTQHAVLHEQHGGVLLLCQPVEA